MDEEWGINDPVVGEDDSETWGENDPVVEDTQEDWGANDPVIGEAEEAAPTAPDILKQYDEAAKGYKERSTALQSAMEGYQALAESPERTPEQEAEMTNRWQSLIRSQAALVDDAAKLRELQPVYDQYFADQKQARIDYIEDRRGSGVFGDEGANALYELDARAEQEYEAARSIEDDQKRKEAVAAIQAKYQTEEKTLNNQFIERFKESETKINNAADVIGQAFAKGQTVDQFLLETGADAEEFNELRDSMLNMDDPEKGKLYREAKAMYDLAVGQTVRDGETVPSRVGIVNNEIRVSPLHVWDAEGIKAEIEALDISDAKKQKTIASIPQLQEEAAKVELPFLQQVKEFNSFVKDNNLENISPKRQIAEWKSREKGWLDYIGKAPAQVGIGLTTGTLGLIEAGQAIVGATALTMGAQDFADPFLDAATKTSDEVQRLTRISQEIGGPTFAAELAAVVPQIVTQIGFGGAVAFGGRKVGLKPKTVSNIGFGSSVGVAFAQSYGGVLSSAFQQLEKEKIDGGMDPIQARAEAVKEAQLPAALSGLSTAVVTTLGGKRGAEAVFRQGADGIKAKLNTAAFRAELDAFIPNVVKGFRNEGYEEFADQLAQGIIEQFSFNPELATSDIINNAFKALVIGGITGGTVEGLKYGYDYMRAPSQMARREASMASMRQSISDVEKEISEAAASSPIGSEFQREYDVTQPSDEAANLGARSVDRTRMTALQEERKQLTELLEDQTISRVARNQLEAKLAAADFEYYNEILTPSRINVVNEQIVDQLDAMAVTQQTKDSVTALAKIANGLGAESLTGRERVAVGITSIGEGRFIASRKNPMVEVTDQGVAKVTEAGRLMAENIGMVPLVRMIGLSETTQAKRAEMQRMAEQVAAQKAQTEAKEAAESEEAKRYGPESAEALKRQAEAQPPAGDKDAQARMAQLLKEQEEAQRKAMEALQKKAAPAEPPVEEPPATPELEPLRRVARAEQTPEDVKALSDAGLVEIYKDQPVITEAGIAALPEAERPRLSPEARKIQIDTGANAVVAEAISKNLRIGVDQVGPNVKMPEGWTLDGDIYVPPQKQEVVKAEEPPVAPPVQPPVAPPTAPPVAPPPTGALTEEQANQVVKDAQEARAKGKPVDVKGSTQYGPRSIEPKQVIGKTAREALLAVSRLNLSKIAQSDPNEIMMQDVAAILAELNMPILDTEQVISLSSIRRKGRARRVRLSDGTTAIALPTTFNTAVELFVHEAGHTITADEIAKYAPRNITGRGKAYLEAINKAIADANTPDPVKRLFTLYVSTMDQLGITEQYFGDKGIAGTLEADTSASMARRLQAQGRLRKDLNWTQLYGLANIEEFVSQTFSEPDFRDLLKTLKDPTQPSRTLWSAFVEAIQRILQLPRESMAAGVIEASIDIGMITVPSRAAGRAAPTPAPRGEMPSIGININDAAQNFTEQILSGEKTIETRATDSLRPYVGRRVGIVRTGVGPAELVGYATIGEPIVYNNVEEFRADQEKHLVEAGSEFDIQEGGVKYGYPLTDVESVTPTPVTSQGIIARKIPQPEVVEGDMAPEGEPEEGKTVEMSLEMEKERTFQLLGERLYTAELPKVVVKETTQNAFDAIKDAEETGEIPRGGGVIGYSRKELEVNGQKIVRMMFSDNGGGMTPEILQNAFFTVGGTFKRSGKGSGGFGLAKLGMFMSADRVMVETVRNGIVTTADLSKQELVDKKFNVNVAEDPNRKNGTMVILEFKKSITRSDGKTVEFENPYTNFDKMIHHNLTVIDDNYGAYQEELIGLFQNKQQGMWSLDEIKKSHGKTPYTFEEFVKDVPNVETFEQDFVITGAKKPIKVRVAAARLGIKGKDGKTKYSENVQIAGTSRNLRNHSMSVYSNGLFQFERENLKIDPKKMWGGDPLPYSIIVDIDAGGLDAASLAYPFTNSREDFQNGVVKDYVQNLLNEIRNKERLRQFDQEFNLLTDISGGKPRKDSPTLYNNTTIVPQPFEQKFLEDLSKTIFDVADDIVVALRKGYEDKILEDDWFKVKSQKGRAPYLGETDEDTLDYFYGVGISKNWGGVNTSRDPVSALVNPVYEERVDEYARSEFGRRILARTIAKTLIHEINHHLHRNEGSDFTFFILQNEAYLGEVGAIQSAVDKILPIVNQHSDAIISLKNKFRTAETKDTDNELTGEQYERSSKKPDGQPRTTVVGGDRLVQQPSTEVSARPTSEEDGEQTGAYLPSSLTAGGRQDAGVGEGISFGDALSSSLVENQAQITEEGISRAEGVEFAPEEEFEIVPEQVEDQIEGTPEASTIKVMGEAFTMANEQSNAEGTPEGTLPLQTITNAWMNSGRDVNTLENAIIRYTNLSPEVAATLAQAISKQLEIQRGIAEVSNMASRKKEEEPVYRPFSFGKRIADELPAYMQNKMNKAYEVLRNEVSIEEANRVMQSMTVEESMAATMKMDNGVSMGVRSMMAQITLRKIMDKRMSTKGKKRDEYRSAVEAHVDFIDWVNEYLMEMGQGIQAFSRFSDLGADGILLKVRKDIGKAIDKHITNRKKDIDKIKRDVEDGDSAAFDATLKANKSNIEKAADNAAKGEAKKLTIEEQAQKLAQRAAQRVAGEVRRRQPDPLSDLVNGHLRKYNKDFLAEARALGVSPETAQKIEESAIKLRDARVATKSERERFKAMQEERMKVKRELARENKYIYGYRPTIWEDYQSVFSERLARRLMRDPKKKIPPSLLLFTDRLTENLLGFVPEAERQASTPKSFQAMIEDALNNKERYQEAFSLALEDISLKIGELEVRMETGEKLGDQYKKALAAQEFLERLAPQIQDFPVSDKLVMRFVGQKTKAANVSIVAKYNEWYRASRTQRKKLEQELAESLVGDVNISNADAVKLARAIVKDFVAKAEERREKALARFKKPKEKSKRLAESPLKKFFELVNMGAMTDQEAYEVMAHRFELPTWDEKFAEKIENMALELQDMPEGNARRKMTQNLMAEIARRKGFSLADLGAGFAYSNMLSSTETFLVNLADTLVNNFTNGFADSVADGNWSRMKGIVQGYRKGWREAVYTFKTGLRINMPRLEEKTPLTVELVKYGKKGGVPLESTEGMNALAKTILESYPAKVLNAWKVVTRIMEATDAFNYTASAEGQRYAEAAKMAKDEGLKGKAKDKRINEILNLGDDKYQAALKQAEQEGYTGADAKLRAIEIQDSGLKPEMRERSFERALTDVYRNMPKGLAGMLAARFDRTIMSFKNPWIRNALKLVNAPFVITPTNLFNKWLDWSPYGYKRLFWGSGNFIDKEGPYYVAPPKVGSGEFYAQAFKASSSVLVMGMVGGLIKAGLLELIGRGPSDEEERKQWLDDGNKPYTFRFMNGPAISFAYSPWALMLSAMANISNWEKYNKKEDATFADRSYLAFLQTVGVIMELPFFSGPADLIDALVVQNNENFVSATNRFVESKYAMLFPNFVRQIDRILDPTVYDSEGIKGMIIDQVPFARRFGNQRLNMFGEPIGEDKPVADRLIGRFAVNPKPSRESRILAKYDAYPYMPNPRQAEALVDGEKAQMTEKQYDEFARGAGQEFKKWLNANYDPDAEVSEQALERGKKRIHKRLSEIRARWVRKVSTY